MYSKAYFKCNIDYESQTKEKTKRITKKNIYIKNLDWSNHVYSIMSTYWATCRDYIVPRMISVTKQLF